MATIRAGESGKRITLVTSFDMSSNTSLAMYFTDPSGNVSEVVGVLGTTTTTDENGNAVAANEWMYYDTETTTLDEAGTWKVQGKYTNTAATPDDVFYTGRVDFTVSEGSDVT